MEFELIRRLRRRIGAHPRVAVGLGDDAAVLRLAGGEQCVVTVDLLTDHVDFELAQVDPRRVGHKALAASLSDLAAMASPPLAGVVALALPRSGGLELAEAIYDGLLPLAQRYDLPIAGGDTNTWDGPLAISVTLLGRVTPRGPLLRSGAWVGDRIMVTGAFGGSILSRHLDFEPRLAEALALAERYRLHAGIDVSDGLSLDLGHMAEESGCGVLVDLAAIPVAEDARRLAERLADGSTPLDHALADGEDFELILAAPPEEAEKMLAERAVDVPLTVIGEVIAERGLWRREGGGRRPLEPRGYQHRFD
jgi:thiamine-monophosphate kinase